MQFFDENRQALADYAHMSQTAGARADYVQGGGGNTSVKLAGGLMAIKASGYCLQDVRPDAAYAVLDYLSLRDFYENSDPGDFPDVEKAGSQRAKDAVRPVEGLTPLRPSVEAGFHSLLGNYVLHTHSVYANLAACAVQSEDILRRALADAPYAYARVPYVNPGARLTFAVRDALRANGATVLFMQNHGLIVHGESAAAVLRIHEDVNARVAAAFGLSDRAFPAVRLAERADGLLENETPLLTAYLRGSGYTDKDMVEDPLYPDQLVFLADVFHMEAGAAAPAAGCCTADTNTGRLLFNMPAAKAQVVAETIAAVLFIRDHIARAGYTLSTMGAEGRAFIANWESEKYRKSLAGK